jgi:signal transduction histidine kinase
VLEVSSADSDESFTGSKSVSGEQVLSKKISLPSSSNDCKFGKSKSLNNYSLHSLEEASDSSNEASEQPIKYETFAKIQIKIIDTGVGIKKENLKKLFMDFSKLDEHSKMNA